MKECRYYYKCFIYLFLLIVTLSVNYKNSKYEESMNQSYNFMHMYTRSFGIS